MKKRNAILTTIAVVMMGALLGTSFARYLTEVNINIEGTTGNLICNMEIDNPGTYIGSDGYAYFKVIVKNYDDQGNISKVPLQYKFTITGTTGSGNDVYLNYLDESGYSNADFTISPFTSRTYSFSADTKSSQQINIYVSTDEYDSENVSFDVDLQCWQYTS